MFYFKKINTSTSGDKIVSYQALVSDTRHQSFNLRHHHSSDLHFWLPAFSQNWKKKKKAEKCGSLRLSSCWRRSRKSFYTSLGHPARTWRSRFSRSRTQEIKSPPGSCAVTSRATGVTVFSTWSPDRLQVARLGTQQRGWEHSRGSGNTAAGLGTQQRIWEHQSPPSTESRVGLCRAPALLLWDTFPDHRDGCPGASAAPTRFEFAIPLPIVQTSLSQLSGNADDSSIGTSDEANVISKTSST